MFTFVYNSKFLEEKKIEDFSKSTKISTLALPFPPAFFHFMQFYCLHEEGFQVSPMSYYYDTYNPLFNMPLRFPIQCEILHKPKSDIHIKNTQDLPS